jgi:alpha-tubulin suppressor-like RCC1 family protein
VAAAAAGWGHSLFVKLDGTLWAMGYNTAGQLGNGTTNNSSLPVLVNGGGLLSAVLAKEPMAIHSLAIAGVLPVVAALTNQTVSFGQPVSFTALLTAGDGSFTYQWLKNGTNIANATNATYSVTGAVMSNAGTYAVVVAGTYGSTTSSVATLTVNKATPNVTTWPTASAIIYGQSLSNSTLSGGTASVAGSFAFTAPGTAPSAGTNAQSVTFTPMDTTNYNAVTDVVSVLVNQSGQTITFPAIGNKVTTDTVGLSATASSGLPVSFSVFSGPASITGGTNLSFSGAGSVSVVANQLGNANWGAASATNTFTVTKAVVTVTLSNTNQMYDGTAKSVTVTTVPAGQIVVVTYNGSAAAPTNAASYTVIATVNESMYQGGRTGTLTIAKAGQTVTFPAIGNKVTTDTVGLSATASSGLPVTFSVFSGPASITGGTSLTFTGAGTVAIVGTQGGNANWSAAPSVTNTFNVTQIEAQVFLQDLAQTYNGAARTVTATTMPTGLTVAVTYEGSAIAPIHAGTYVVTGMVADARYQGSATDLLVVAPADQTIDFPAIGEKVTTDTVGLAATASSGLPVAFAVASGRALITDGTNLTFTGAGLVEILATQPGNGDWNAAPEVYNSFNALFVNHAPEGADQTVTTLEDTPYVFSAADFGFSDLNDIPTNAFAGVHVTTLPDAGTLFSDGNAVTSGQRVTDRIPGVDWTARESNRNWRSIATSTNGLKLVAAGTNEQIYTSADGGGTWTARESSRKWYAVASSADGTRLVAVVDGGLIYTSADSGETWTARETARLWRAVASSADGTKLVAAVRNGQIFTSADSGETWTARASVLVWNTVASSADGTKLVAGAFGNYLYTSRDSGATWTQRATALSWSSVASSADGTKLVAGVYGGRLYTSTNAGSNWTIRASTTNWVSLASSADGTKLAAGVENGPLYISTNSGVAWVARATNRIWRSVASSGDGTRLFAVHDTGRIYTSCGGFDLTFTPAPNAYGNPYAHFTFQVQDNGGTANGGTDIDPTPDTLTINVTPVPDDQTITFSAMGDKVITNVVGLAATASSGLPVSFTVSSGPASITGGTNLTFTGVGTVSIVASQAGNVDWNAAPNVTNTFTVSKIVPVITTWPTASYIILGQTLASSTLSGGISSVAGLFAFTEPATVPSEGTAAQNVTFTPTDSANYITVTGSVEVSVLSPPIITVQPVNAVVTVGQAVSLSVSNSGSAPVAYQWLKDGAMLVDQTNRTLSLSTFTFTDSGSYSVVITNMMGMVISRPSTLSVPNAPLQAWGYNNHGQLGNGMTINSTRPVTVASNVVAAAGGLYHSLFVKADGTLWCMGYNGYGALGDRIPILAKTNRPVALASNVVAAAAGADYSLFVTADGTLWSMGFNYWGMLGNGTTTDTNRPVAVASNVVAIAAGSGHSLFIKADGTLWAMGWNNKGQLGNGTTNDTSWPVAVASNVVAMAAGGNHSLFVKADRTLWAMGNNLDGQLGNRTNGAAASVNRPVAVASNVTAVAAGQNHSLFTKTDRTLWAMGQGNNGQLGIGIAYSSTNRPVFVASNVTAVAAGQNHSLFLKTGGSLWAAGWNYYNQIGNGTATDATLPVLVNDGGLAASSLATGSSYTRHSFAIAGALPVVTAITNQTVMIDQPVSFAAVVTAGEGPFTCQWQKNGVNIPNATNTTFTIASTVSADAGNYAVVVFGAYGYTTSAAATLTVNGGVTLVTLTIQSAHGIASPAVGIYTNVSGALWTNSVVSPDVYGTTRYVCSGWSLTGNSPASGSSNRCVLTLTNHAVLTWLWTTQYQLSTAAGSNGSVNVGSGWQTMGVTTQITAQAGPYYHFANWTGSVTGTVNPLNLLMDGPKAVTAVFAANMTTNQPTPLWWMAQYGLTGNVEQVVLADSDGDRISNWQEYIAGTVPTNPASKLVVATPSPIYGTNAALAGYAVNWSSVTGRVYDVEVVTNLLKNNWIPLSGATNLQGTAPVNTFTDTTATEAKFYRIKVRLP